MSELTEEERAAAFYASAKPGAEQPAALVETKAAPAANQSAKAGTSTTGDDGPSGLELVRSDRERKFFDVEMSHGRLYDELTATDGFDGGMPRGIAPADGVDRREFAEIVADHGASHADVREFLTDYRDFMETKLTDADKQVFLADAVRGMKQEFGDEWEHAWDAANALAKRDPRIAKMLTESGLGADRQTVIRFAKEALRQRVAGKLK
jgi:hypothetical protein